MWRLLLGRDVSALQKLARWLLGGRSVRLRKIPSLLPLDTLRRPTPNRARGLVVCHSTCFMQSLGREIQGLTTPERRHLVMAADISTSNVQTCCRLQHWSARYRHCQVRVKPGYCRPQSWTSHMMHQTALEREPSPVVLGPILGAAMRAADCSRIMTFVFPTSMESRLHFIRR